MLELWHEIGGVLVLLGLLVGFGFALGFVVNEVRWRWRSRREHIRALRRWGL